MPRTLETRVLMSLFIISLSLSSVSRADEEFENCAQYNPAPGSSDYSALIACAYRLQAEKKAAEEKEYQKQAEASAKENYANSPSHSGMSYQRCILDKAPAVQNDLAAKGVITDCSQYRGYAREREADWLFGYSTAKECFKSLGSKTGSQLASRLIAGACLDLYPGDLF